MSAAAATATVDNIMGLIVAWAKRLGAFALIVVVSVMLLKLLATLLGYPLNVRVPALDQSTGIALAALAYVLK